MRTLLFTLSLLFIMSQGAMADHGQNKCRKGYNNFQDGLTLAEQITSDLLSGMWTYEFDGSKQIIEFHSDGKVDILQENIRGEIQHVTATWRIEGYSGHAFLVMKPTISNEEQLYQIHPTCKGMELTNVIAKESKELVFEPKVEDSFYDQIKNLLSGTWRSISYPFKETGQPSTCDMETSVKDAFLEITLHDDGQYIMHVGAGEYEVEEMGTWALTSDASHIIFRSSTDDSGDTRKHRAAAINMLEFHEMVLEQRIALDIRDKEFCSEWKPFSFHKLSI